MMNFIKLLVACAAFVFAIALGLFMLAVVVSIINAPKAEAASTDPSIVLVDSFRSGWGKKYWDKDNNVVCYVYSGYGISCVK